MRLAAAAAVIALGSGCRLDPLVGDKPGASAHILPAGTEVPSAMDSLELVNQINANDGVDDKAIAGNNGIIPRGTGVSAGLTVRYWSFGLSNRAPSPMYKFFARSEAGDLSPIDHPPLVDALPGDAGYSGVHAIIRVVVTDAYDGERITSSEALADALDLGLIEDPMPTGTFVTSPIVLPGTKLDTGAAAPVVSEPVYGRGYEVGAFELGGARGVQPVNLFVPTNQVSFLRAAGTASFDTTRPVFQATIPAAPPATSTASYTPLCVVVDVELASTTMPTMILADDQLFERTPGGDIKMAQPGVGSFQVTTSILLLPIQFTEGEL
ncbi:MAG TPA: hypothetical protein VFK02_12640 [Kofleriaceae bacterium]|nr:hypothetical protein [Kofleriaceae bacterium]